MPAIPTPNYLVGTVMAVVADGITMYATKSDVARSVNLVKVTNAKSGGYAQVKPGIKSAKGSVECVQNGDDLVNLTLGKEVTIVWTPTGGTARTFQAVISVIKESFVVDGELTYAFDWESSGSF